MTDKLDLSRSVQVKDGVVARYLGMLARNSHPHIVAVQQLIGGEIVVQFDDYGRSQDERLTLINVPEPKRSGEVWVNVYGGKGGSISWPTRKEADYYATAGRVACIGPIKWTEGEGL